MVNELVTLLLGIQLSKKRSSFIFLFMFKKNNSMNLTEKFKIWSRWKHYNQTI